METWAGIRLRGSPGSCRRIGEHVEDEQSVDAQVAYGPATESPDARVVIDFGVGPDGVGPVMGFESGDFFPSAPVAEADPAEPTDAPGTGRVG